MKTKTLIIHNTLLTIYEDGRIWRHAKLDGVGRFMKGKFLQGHIIKQTGYATVNISHKGKKKRKYVHGLLQRHFLATTQKTYRPTTLMEIKQIIILVT